MDGGISIPILIGAAVIDSINPCAFGVLIFLLSFLLETTKKPSKLLLHGLVYIAAVFITYFSAGLILLPIIDTLGSISTFLYVVLGVMVIIAGLLEIKDYFWYGKGPSLTLLPGADKRVKMYSEKISKSVGGAFALGVFVALVELPCTGAVYLAVLSLMTLSGVNISNVLFLVIYNLIFVAPLLFILFSMYFGVSADKFEHWRKEHRGLMRLFIGLVLVAMGLWMIFYRVGG
jgi:cytochrome c biogenesis protein CcdA